MRIEERADLASAADDADPRSDGPDGPSIFENLFPDEASLPHTRRIKPSTFLRQRGARWYDYVVTEDGWLIAAERIAGQGHANLALGRPVRSAGQVQVSGGQVVQIDNASGHYLPWGGGARREAIRAFREAGFPVPEAVYVAKAWNPLTRLWEPIDEPTAR